MIQTSCLCGRITVALGARPEFIHQCNCTLCRKTGAWWAYCHPADVTVCGDAEMYSRQDKEEPAAAIRFCPRCGATTHFALTDAAAAKFGNTVIGVNMLLADERDLAGIELRFPDGKAWPGSGNFSYVRAPQTLGNPVS